MYICVFVCMSIFLISVYICVSICMSIFLISVYICVSICMSIFNICVSICMSILLLSVYICVSICMSIFLISVNICVSICMSIFLISVYLSVCLCVYLSVYLSVCLCVYLSVYICVSVCMSIFLISVYICVSICMSIFLTSVHLYVCLCVCLSVYICVSVCMSMCLSICVYPCICLYVYVSIYLCISVYLSVCLCVYLSVYISVYEGNVRSKIDYGANCVLLNSNILENYEDSVFSVEKRNIQNNNTLIKIYRAKIQHWYVFHDKNKVQELKRINPDQNIFLKLAPTLFTPQTTQTAHTLYLDRLSRPIVSRHAIIRFHVIFFDWHLTANCCIEGLSFTSFKEIFQFKHRNITFMNIIYFLRFCISYSKDP